MSIIRLVSENPFPVYTIDGEYIPVKTTQYLDKKGQADSISYIEIGEKKIYTKHQATLTTKLASASLDEVLADIETARVSEAQEEIKIK